jgi:hypothetical protein|tara:strand:+ start:1698 stop:1886 length:189 start_codon:yes stop_codon:yes gene_type:complete
MSKKTWNKSKATPLIMDIGKCKYCSSSMTNDESFVAFYGGDKAHYECMRNDDQEKATDKSYE